MDDWYEARAKELVEQAERRHGEELADFYFGLVRSCNVLLERLELAREELPGDAADAIYRDLDI